MATKVQKAALELVKQGLVCAYPGGRYTRSNDGYVWQCKAKLSPAVMNRLLANGWIRFLRENKIALTEKGEKELGNE